MDRAAKFFLIAALGFVALGMLFPGFGPMERDDRGFEILFGLNFLAILIALGAFNVGVITLVRILPKLGQPPKAEVTG